jgi:Got1/Sft2-like family
MRVRVHHVSVFVHCHHHNHHHWCSVCTICSMLLILQVFSPSCCPIAGPMEHLQSLCQPERLLFTFLYFGSMFLTLYFTFSFGGASGYIVSRKSWIFCRVVTTADDFDCLTDLFYSLDPVLTMAYCAMQYHHQYTLFTSSARHVGLGGAAGSSSMVPD